MRVAWVDWVALIDINASLALLLGASEGVSVARWAWAAEVQAVPLVAISSWSDGASTVVAISALVDINAARASIADVTQSFIALLALGALVRADFLNASRVGVAVFARSVALLVVLAAIGSKSWAVAR